MSYDGLLFHRLSGLLGNAAGGGSCGVHGGKRKGAEEGWGNRGEGMEGTSIEEGRDCGGGVHGGKRTGEEEG